MIQTNDDLILESDEKFNVRLELTEENEIIGVKLDDPNVATVTIINTNGITLLCHCIAITYIAFVLFQLFL